MTQNSLQFGKEGEKAAVAYLKKNGYRILEKNFRNSIGEIDIIAEHQKAVVFIEVKTRTDHEFGAPITAINPAKQRKITKLAQSFLAQKRIEDRECRFDVVSITGPPGQPKQWVIELIPDAFRQV